MAPSRNSSALAIGALLLAVGTLAAAEDAASPDTCTVTGDNSAAFASTAPKEEATVEDPFAEQIKHCSSWEPGVGMPHEHLETACDRERQNAAWQADHAEATSAPAEDLIPDTVYLNMAEEKTWVCPLDSATEGVGGASNSNMVDPNGGPGPAGHPTRWVMHNRASSPVILTHVNALGLEVSAHDFAAFPAHSNTAVYPHGPIVLPGQMAVVEGRQGHVFVAREYKEVLPIHAMAAEGDQHSWNSFKSVLPSTLSFLPEQTRYETSKGVVHVLGNPGRILLKHRMGNIYIRNESGAMCPTGGGGGGGGEPDDEDVGDGREGNPKDMNPLCNVLRKAFVNRVGCPIDVYFSPHAKVEGDAYNCETFTKHLGPFEPFMAKDPATRDIDGHSSPLKFENTYNGHSFVARMAHDQSLVMRIDIDHDIARDCPEPSKARAQAAVRVDEAIVSGVFVDAASNATEAVYASSNACLVGAKDNATKVTVAAARPRREKRDLVWPNRTGVVMAAVPMAS